MEIILLRYNLPALKFTQEVIESIKAENNLLYITTIDNNSFVGYHIKFESVWS